LFSKIGIPNFISYFFKVTVLINPQFRKLFHEYDVLHFHDDVDISFSLFSFFTGKPKIFHIHSLQRTFKGYKYNLFSRLILTKSANLHLTASQVNANLMNEFGASEVKILPNGVDIEKFDFKLDNREQRLILFVGRFERDKGIHILLESLKLLDMPTKLVIIGPNQDTAYLNDMLHVIEEINREKKHEILYLGSLSHDEIIQWHHRATIFVCPSLHEDFGIVILEAMSSGTPVIASDIGGIKDIITNNHEGILVVADNKVKLAEAIENLLKDEKLRQDLAKEARIKIERKFTWLSVTKELSEIYEKLVDTV